MTEFVYYTSSSLNGFIADAHNSLEWLFAVDAREAPIRRHSSNRSVFR